ncbi:hypothetical protein [Flavobacterium sp.]|jgi:hypothetical protein|uniref:hypothetical protein n=1 Tax=Flavobacterium sp. TaxID=239 RepID=UPI0037C05118
MKKKFVLIFLFFYAIVTGQVQKDTVYLYFNHKKNMSLKTTVSKNNEPFSYIYTYYFNDSLNSQLLIPTNIDDLIDFDNKADVKWIDKKFIRKNDEKVYCIKKMQKIGHKNSIDKFYNCVVYLIDTKIKKNNKYKALEVNINFLEEM